MSFGMLLLAFFLSPVYFAVRGRWVAAIINGIFYVTALFTLFFGFGIFIWIFCVAHAVWDLISHRQEQIIQRQATAIAAKMGKGDS